MWSRCRFSQVWAPDQGCPGGSYTAAYAAEDDATALEAECLGRFRDWFVMLATTRMTKSFKMVLLRVLLDNDAVFSGMPILELVEVPDLDPPLSITHRATTEVTR